MVSGSVCSSQSARAMVLPPLSVHCPGGCVRRTDKFGGGFSFGTFQREGVLSPSRVVPAFPCEHRAAIYNVTRADASLWIQHFDAVHRKPRFNDEYAEK